MMRWIFLKLGRSMLCIDMSLIRFFIFVLYFRFSRSRYVATHQYRCVASIVYLFFAYWIKKSILRSWTILIGVGWASRRFCFQTWFLNMTQKLFLDSCCFHPCVCVCLSVNYLKKSSWSISLKFGKTMFNDKRQVPFEDGIYQFDRDMKC